MKILVGQARNLFVGVGDSGQGRVTAPAVELVCMVDERRWEKREQGKLDSVSDVQTIRFVMDERALERHIGFLIDTLFEMAEVGGSIRYDPPTGEGAPLNLEDRIDRIVEAVREVLRPSAEATP